jgi:O-antigen/teichoic acid export membrane protein
MGTDMPGRREGRLPAWLVGSSVIAVAMGVMNIGTYGFTILAARVLGPVDYGALAAVMGLLLVVNVLSLGLQATGARRVAADPRRRPQIEAAILAASYRSALVLGLICLAASPVVAHLLKLDSVLTVVFLAVTVVPLTVMGGQAGILQGETRWLPLGIIYLATGVGRLLFGAVAIWVQPDALGAMAGVAVGAFLPTVAGWYAIRHASRASHPDVDPDGTDPDRPAAGELFKEIAHNSHALLAFFALSNADVVLARSVLDEHDAGLYAAGLIMAKAVLFLPQFVIVVAFPSMSRIGASRRAHLRGLSLVLAIGLLTSVGVLALSALAVVFVGGEAYAEIEDQLWAFAILGTLLALVQIMVYAILARQGQRSVLLIWAALATLLVLVPLVDSVRGLLTLVVCVDAALLAVLLLLSLRSEPASSVGGRVPARSGAD